MAHVFITNDVKKLFILCFREIFAYDADFTYNKTDAELGKLLISSKYAEPKTENKLPQLIFSTVAYNGDVLTLGNNFAEERSGFIRAGVVQNSQRRYSNIIQFQLSIDCVSTVKAECELVADKVFNALTVEDAQLFQELDMNIRRVNVGEAIPRNQYPQYQFIAPITVQGDFMIQWTMEPTSEHPLLGAVQLQIQLPLEI
jgi:hypothetical protein